MNAAHITREGAVTVTSRGAAIPVGYVNRAPGGRWEATTVSGKSVATHLWTRDEAVQALVKRLFPQGVK